MNTHMTKLYAVIGQKPRLKDLVDDSEAYLDYEEYGDILEEASMLEAAEEYELLINRYNEETTF